MRWRVVWWTAKGLWLGWEDTLWGVLLTRLLAPFFPSTGLRKNHRCVVSIGVRSPKERTVRYALYNRNRSCWSIFRPSEHAGASPYPNGSNKTMGTKSVHSTRLLRCSRYRRRWMILSDSKSLIRAGFSRTGSWFVSKVSTTVVRMCSGEYLGLHRSRHYVILFSTHNMQSWVVVLVSSLEDLHFLSCSVTFK